VNCDADMRGVATTQPDGTSYWCVWHKLRIRNNIKVVYLHTRPMVKSVVKEFMKNGGSQFTLTCFSSTEISHWNGKIFIFLKD